MGVTEVFGINDLKFHPGLPAGSYLFVHPDNQLMKLEWEGPVGSGSDLFFGLTAWMGKNGWNTKKVDESIEVSPLDKQYHDLVIGQKQELEARIKQGLGQAAVAVGDYELLLHDERKLREFLDYFEKVEKARKEYAEAKKTRDADKIKKARQKLINAEVQTKAIFVDQVDVHNGNSGLATAVQRWPTIIVDFQSIVADDLIYDNNGELKEDDAAKAIAQELGVTKAEGLVLVVKQKLYDEWKKMLSSALLERYSRIKQLVEGRSKSVKIYREWLKPYVARHKLITESFSDVSNASSFNQLPYWTSGTAGASQEIKTWSWKRLPIAEYNKPSAEKREKEFLINPVDDVLRALCFGGKIRGKEFSGFKTKGWIRNEKGKIIGVEFEKDAEGKMIPIKNGDKCLMLAHDGLGAEQICEWIEKMVSEGGSDALNVGSSWGPLDPYSPYYFFMEIKVDRFIIKGPTGQFEDATFTLKNSVISQNILLFKLLECKADEWKFERHVNEMLGMEARDKDGKLIDINDILKRDYPTLSGVGKKPDKKAEQKGIFSGIGGALTQPFKDVFHTTTQPFKDSSSGLGSTIKNFLEKYGFEISWSRGGPYERDFKDRITGVYLKAAGGEFGAVTGQLRSMMGM